MTTLHPDLAEEPPQLDPADSPSHSPLTLAIALVITLALTLVLVPVKWDPLGSAPEQRETPSSVPGLRHS